MPRHELRLLTCQNKQYIIKETELHHCAQTSETILCPQDLLATVDSPDWLGPKWSPYSKLIYQHAHVSLPSCNNLHQLLHISSCYLFNEAMTRFASLLFPFTFISFLVIIRSIRKQPVSRIVRRKWHFNFHCFIMVSFILFLGKQCRRTTKPCCPRVKF